MKTKIVLWTVAVTALVVAVLLISLEAYYVAIALILGTLIMGHREIWSLVSRGKFPPIDERVRENTGKAIRNGFIFYAMATAFLMLPFSGHLSEGPSTVRVLGGLFLSAGMVYLLSYLYYDRVEPGLGERWMRWLKIFMRTAGISLAAGIISVFLHNAFYALFILWFGEDFWDRIGMPDEPVFFMLAMLSAVTFVVGIIGSIVIFIRGLFTRTA